MAGRLVGWLAGWLVAACVLVALEIGEREGRAKGGRYQRLCIKPAVLLRRTRTGGHKRGKQDGDC